jgi:hypothetical protein
MVQSDLARRLGERSEIPLRLSEGPRGFRVCTGRSVSASTWAEGFMAAVLLGVVELWLSLGRLNTARTGVWGFGRTNLRAPARRSQRNIHRSQDPAPLVFQREPADLLLRTLDDVLASTGH